MKVFYTSNLFICPLLDHGVQINMDCKGHRMDNIFIERLEVSKVRKYITGGVLNCDYYD